MLQVFREWFTRSRRLQNGKKICIRSNHVELFQNLNASVFYPVYRIIYSTVFLPILQSLIYCYSIGVNFENMPIAIKNDEVDFKSCQHFNLNECIFDDEDNDQPLSCVVVNHLQSLDYDLVSESWTSIVYR